MWLAFSFHSSFIRLRWAIYDEINNSEKIPDATARTKFSVPLWCPFRTCVCRRSLQIKFTHCVNSLSPILWQILAWRYRRGDLLQLLLGSWTLFKKLKSIEKPKWVIRRKKAYPLIKKSARNKRHFEVIRVFITSKRVWKVTKYFFEIHDFTQKDGQWQTW